MGSGLSLSTSPAKGSGEPFSSQLDRLRPQRAPPRDSELPCWPARTSPGLPSPPAPQLPPGSARGTCPGAIGWPQTGTEDSLPVLCSDPRWFLKGHGASPGLTLCMWTHFRQGTGTACLCHRLGQGTGRLWSPFSRLLLTRLWPAAGHGAAEPQTSVSLGVGACGVEQRRAGAPQTCPPCWAHHCCPSRLGGRVTWGRQRGPRSRPPLGEQEGPGQAAHPVHSTRPSGWSHHMLVASLSHPAAPRPVPPLRPGPALGGRGPPG